jgi:hypothetical protein
MDSVTATLVAQYLDPCALLALRSCCRLLRDCFPLRCEISEAADVQVTLDHINEFILLYDAANITSFVTDARASVLAQKVRKDSNYLKCYARMLLDAGRQFQVSCCHFPQRPSCSLKCIVKAIDRYLVARSLTTPSPLYLVLRRLSTPYVFAEPQLLRLSDGEDIPRHGCFNIVWLGAGDKADVQILFSEMTIFNLQQASSKIVHCGSLTFRRYVLTDWPIIMNELFYTRVHVRNGSLWCEWHPLDIFPAGNIYRTRITCGDNILITFAGSGALKYVS